MIETLRRLRDDVFNERRTITSADALLAEVAPLVPSMTTAELEKNKWRLDGPLNVAVMNLRDCTGFSIAAALVAEIAAECGRRDEAESERRREYMAAHPPQHMWGDGGYAGLCAND